MQHASSPMTARRSGRSVFNDDNVAMTISKRQAVHWLFDLAVAIKAVNGLIEIIGGYVLIFKPGWIGPAVATWRGGCFEKSCGRSLRRWSSLAY